MGGPLPSRLIAGPLGDGWHPAAGRAGPAIRGRGHARGGGGLLCARGKSQGGRGLLRRPQQVASKPASQLGVSVYRCVVVLVGMGWVGM